jgi:aldehyde:ferredoxin oxidoreductase
VEKLAAQYGKKVACITIGQAGEMKMSAASIAVTDMEQRPTRHAGRGGVGAVMGSKGIKAIVLDDDGMKMRQPADPEKFKAANKAFAEGLRKHPVTGEGLPAFGTNVLTNVVNEAGGLPHQQFPDRTVRRCIQDLRRNPGRDWKTSAAGKGSATHGCHRGCIIRCSGTFYDKNGNFVTKQPEYETVWAHGGNCGIDDLDAIAHAGPHG